MLSAIATLFGNFGEDFQALNARAAALHNEFVKLMTISAAAYVEADLANGAALLHTAGALTAGLGADRHSTTLMPKVPRNAFMASVSCGRPPRH